MKTFLMVTLLASFLSIIAQADQVDLKGQTLVFDNAVWTGPLSDKFDHYKEYILLSTSNDQMGILSCNNGVTAFGPNWIELTVTNRKWGFKSLGIQYFPQGDCHKIAAALLEKKTSIKVQFGAQSHISFSNGTSYFDMTVSTQPNLAK